MFLSLHIKKEGTEVINEMEGAGEKMMEEKQTKGRQGEGEGDKSESRTRGSG